MRFARAAKRGSVGNPRRHVLPSGATHALCGVRCGERLAPDDPSVFALTPCPDCKTALRAHYRSSAR